MLHAEGALALLIGQVHGLGVLPYPLLSHPYFVSFACVQWLLIWFWVVVVVGAVVAESDPEVDPASPHFNPLMR